LTHAIPTAAPSGSAQGGPSRRRKQAAWLSLRGRPRPVLAFLTNHQESRWGILPMRILMMAMAMAVASGNAFIASPKTQLAARRTLPHARAMPIVAAYSKIEDEAKDTEVCPHACVMSHLAYGPREPVDLLPLARARPLSPSPHDTTVHAFTAHPQLSPLLPAQCSRLCPRRQSKL
jgi:hypothetical protein